MPHVLILKHVGLTRTEALLYSHLLSLPYFLFVADDIFARITQWHARPALVVNVFGTEVHTTIWAALLINGFTQYLCISAVFQLLSCVTSLVGGIMLRCISVFITD